MVRSERKPLVSCQFQGIIVDNLLNIFRSVASGYDVQLLGGVTSKASTAALNKLAFGVNMLGNRFAPWSVTLIPAECESSAAYLQAYGVTKSAARRVISLPTFSPTASLTRGEATRPGRDTRQRLVHALEALPGRWSPDILFKCNCPEFFKNAA